MKYWVSRFIWTEWRFVFAIGTSSISSVAWTGKEHNWDRVKTERGPCMGEYRRFVCIRLPFWGRA